MKHKVSELTGALLDAAVAKAEGLLFSHIEDDIPWLFLSELRTASVKECPRFSARWDAGGPIIERERIVLFTGETENEGVIAGWAAVVGGANVGTFCGCGGFGDFDAIGPTPLVAAMRAFVASNFGKEVDL